MLPGLPISLINFSCLKSFNLRRFNHSFSSLSYDRSKASSKASSPHSAIQSFLFQMRVSSPFLKVIQQLPTSSPLSSCHFYPPLYLSFNNPLYKAVSTQNVPDPVRLPFTYFMQLYMQRFEILQLLGVKTCFTKQKSYMFNTNR